VSTLPKTTPVAFSSPLANRQYVFGIEVDAWMNVRWRRRLEPVFGIGGRHTIRIEFNAQGV
jgi:hypothetical protein